MTSLPAHEKACISDTNLVISCVPLSACSYYNFVPRSGYKISSGLPLFHSGSKTVKVQIHLLKYCIIFTLFYYQHILELIINWCLTAEINAFATFCFYIIVL